MTDAAALDASQGTDAHDDLTEMALFDAKELDTVPSVALADRFTLPPFSVLNAREGWWKGRKRQWVALGIKSEEGRDAKSYAGGIKEEVLAAFLAELERLGNGKRQRKHVPAAAATCGIPEVVAYQASIAGGTSVFDPVLCEIAYRWFCPEGGWVLDPYAGGSVRGVVASMLGRRYVGMDLSERQCEANELQQAAIELKGYYPKSSVPPLWLPGDSTHLRDVLEGSASADARSAASGHCVDLVFSCPPYGDLEVYSDDPADLSNMPWDPEEAKAKAEGKRQEYDPTAPTFLGCYQEAISEAVECLADDRFCAWVVGEIRGPDGAYRGLVPETIRLFELAGARYYNELILVSPTGSLQLRTARIFTGSRKLGRTHQTMLVFVKGDPKVAAQACDPKIIEAMGGSMADLDDMPDEDLSGMGHG